MLKVGDIFMAGLATDLSAMPNPVIVKTALEDIEWLMENTVAFGSAPVLPLRTQQQRGKS